jgi:hypothetical protein
MRIKKYIKKTFFYIFIFRMENIEKVFMIAVIITCIYVISKIIEMKYIDKEFKPMKYLVKDAITIFASSCLGSFIYFNLDGNFMDFMNVVTNNKSFNMSSTQIFTDEPGF